jgi:uncharacterized membrane protein
MSELIAIAYRDERRAAKVVAALKSMRDNYLLDLEDAVYVTKDSAGKVEIHQTLSTTGAGAGWGSVSGLLVGALFLVPIAGLLVGAGVGALAGKLTDVGIRDDFVRTLSAELRPGSSAVIALVSDVAADKVAQDLSRFGGTILRTSLSQDAEAKLQETLSAGSGSR